MEEEDAIETSLAEVDSSCVDHAPDVLNGRVVNLQD